MAGNPLHDVAIVGAFNTVQAKVLEGATDLSIIRDAIRGVLAQAGMTLDEVDGVNISVIRGGFSSRNGVHMLGGRPSWTGHTEIGIPSVLEAAGAIATGQAQTVLISSGQAGMYTDHSATSPWTRPSNEFVECWGLYTAAEFALIAKRHMALYGTTPEQMAEVASAIRSNGALNPDAVFYGRGKPLVIGLCCTGAALVLIIALEEKKCDAVTIARPLVANNDLVRMFEAGLARHWVDTGGNGCNEP